MLDQDTIKIENFGGLYSNVDEDKVPIDHFVDCLNLEFFPGGFNSRVGTDLLYTIAGVVRIKRYEIPGAADRILVLRDNNSLYDATASLAVPILTISGMTDFSCVSLYGRAYISPHNGEEGLQDTPLYVYDPSVSATARVAAGDPPTDFTLTVASQTVTVVNSNVAAAQAFTSGTPLTLTASPYIPATPTTIRFTLAVGGSTITAMTLTVVGKNAAHESTTKIYVNKVLSAGPLTFTGIDIWSEITSITPSAITGGIAAATLRVQATGLPPGKVERGYHVIAVAYESESGFITRPGPAAGTGTNYNVFLVTIPKRGLLVSGWPASLPDGMTKVHILASKAIVRNRYTGNPDDYELFFVGASSGGVVDEGITSRVINFFDADLVDSADFLKDNMSQIPAGVTLLATSKGRLLVAGLNQTSVVGDGDQDELSNNTVIFASVGGEPESFSFTDGFVIVKPGGEGLRNLAEYRGLIYAYKGTRTYVTQDNGGLPSTWEINSVDDAIGTECHGVSVALGADSSNEDVLIIAAKSGLQLFDGTYAERPLTWKIQGIWDAIAVIDQFEDIEVAIDPTNKAIFVAIPFNTVDYLQGGFILYGNYTNGLDWQNIKWSPWQFYRSGGILTPDSIFTTFQSGQCVLRIGSSDGNIFTYNKADPTFINDNGNAKTVFYETAKLSFSEGGGVSGAKAIRQKIFGSGTLHSSLISPQAILSENLPDETLTDGRSNLFQRVNFVEDDFSYRAEINGLGEQFTVSKIWIFGKEEWVERPA